MTTSADSFLSKRIQQGPSKSHQSRDVERGRSAGPIQDSNVEGWNGPRDPRKPQNWPLSKRLTIFAIILSVNFLGTYCFVMVAPSVPQILQNFGSSSQNTGSVIVTIYSFGGIIGPLLVKPVSAAFGRLIVHQISISVFLAFTIAYAVAPNLGALLLFRLGVRVCFPPSNNPSPLSALDYFAYTDSCNTNEELTILMFIIELPGMRKQDLLLFSLESAWERKTYKLVLRKRRWAQCWTDASIYS